VRNMNHIVLGTDDQNHLGMILSFVGIGVVILLGSRPTPSPGSTPAPSSMYKSSSPTPSC